MTIVKIKKAKNKNKTKKEQKQCVIKWKLEFENYKICLKAIQLGNKKNYIEKNKIDINSFFCYKWKHKEFTRNNKLILKKHSKDLKSERHNVFTEEINKIAWSSNDNKRMQSTDLIKTYAYGTSKVLVSQEDEIKRNNIKWYKND